MFFLVSTNPTKRARTNNEFLLQTGIIFLLPLTMKLHFCSKLFKKNKKTKKKKNINEPPDSFSSHICWKNLLAIEMCINPRLKIVPNKCKMFSCLRKFCERKKKLKFYIMGDFLYLRLDEKDQ